MARNFNEGPFGNHLGGVSCLPLFPIRFFIARWTLSTDLPGVGVPRGTGAKSESNFRGKCGRPGVHDKHLPLGSSTPPSK